MICVLFLALGTLAVSVPKLPRHFSIGVAVATPRGFTIATTTHRDNGNQVTLEPTPHGTVTTLSLCRPQVIAAEWYGNSSAGCAFDCFDGLQCGTGSRAPCSCATNLPFDTDPAAQYMGACPGQPSSQLFQAVGSVGSQFVLQWCFAGSVPLWASLLFTSTLTNYTQTSWSTAKPDPNLFRVPNCTCAP